MYKALRMLLRSSTSCKYCYRHKELESSMTERRELSRKCIQLSCNSQQLLTCIQRKWSTWRMVQKQPVGRRTVQRSGAGRNISRSTTWLCDLWVGLSASDSGKNDCDSLKKTDVWRIKGNPTSAAEDAALISFKKQETIAITVTISMYHSVRVAGANEEVRKAVGRITTDGA